MLLRCLFDNDVLKCQHSLHMHAKETQEECEEERYILPRCMHHQVASAPTIASIAELCAAAFVALKGPVVLLAR